MRGGNTFTVSRFEQNLRKQRGEGWGFSLWGAKWLITGVVEVLIIPCSLVPHYQCIKEFLCPWGLCLLSACMCVLWRLLLSSFREGEILISHIWLWSSFCLHSTPICSQSQCRALSLLGTQWRMNLHTRAHTHTERERVRHTSLLLLVIFLEVLLLRGPETSADRNLGPLVGFIFFSFYW